MKTRQAIAKRGRTPLKDSKRSKPIKKDVVSCTSKKDKNLMDEKPKDDELLKRIDKLEFVIRKIAHFSGNNRILIESGLNPWIPGKEDMRKYKS